MTLRLVYWLPIFGGSPRRRKPLSEVAFDGPWNRPHLR